MIRVAVADDQTLVRSGFSVLLRSAADIEVVGEAADGDEAVALVRREHPTSCSWTSACPVPTASRPPGRSSPIRADSGTRVLILTTFDLDEYVFDAIRSGASGFLLKDTLPDDLLAAVRVVAAGEALLAPSVTRRLMEQFVHDPRPAGATRSPALDTLTAGRPRSSPPWRAACRTPRSPRRCSCPTPRPRPT